MAARKRIPVPPARPTPAPKPQPPAKPTAGQNGPRPPQKPTVAPKAAPRRITRDSTLRVLISGASGMIGTELQRQLTEAGHTVLTLVRRAPSKPTEYTWAPDAKILDFRLLEDVDAVVNLSGASLSRIPWTPGWKRTMHSSRINSTRALVEAMTMANRPPAVFVSASGSGFYGHRPGERLTEESGKGTGFLADLVADWEDAASLAPAATRTVLLRSGVVLGPQGAMAPLRLQTKLGLGGKLGTGKQFWPVISLHDEAAAIVHLLTSTLSGPVNIAVPEPVTAEALGARLAKTLHRPFVFRAPERILTLALQDVARDMLLVDQQMIPARLVADGFTFRHATAEEAVDAYAR